MKTKSIYAAALAVIVLASPARAQFVPGHVFVSEPWREPCGGSFPGDRIWEIDPETGEVSLFVELTPEQCGLISGLVFTPDGTGLRASLAATDQIVEFDSDANMTVVLDAEDGITGPGGSNNLAYDRDGNFYVALSGPANAILRFPADGGPATVFADQSDGVGGGGAIAFASDGDLYYGRAGPKCYVLQITPDGTASEFDHYGFVSCGPRGVTGDERGYVYVGVGGDEIFRYEAGDPGSKQLLVSGAYLALVPAMTMSPDQSRIYVAAGRELFAVDPVDGTVTKLAEIADGDRPVHGIAVVPVVPPVVGAIPAASGWGLVVMGLALLTLGRIMTRRVRRDPDCAGTA